MNPPSGVPSLFSFPKQQRLLRRPEFTRTMDNGTKIVTPYLVMIGRRSSGPTSRIGFIVSKKVGGAVTRNRVKRRLRELFRTLPDRPLGMDLVVIARGQAVGADYEALGQSFAMALGKVNQRLEREALRKAASTDS
ncbi:MAG: ribonuclease P protein component [Proteobacteria bacterium]|nr:MAG: ribonuclease P protein component [Pseudomonadota bacterium]